MSQKWLDAAERYRRAEEKQRAQPAKVPPQQETQVREDRWRLQAVQNAEAARELEQFMNSSEGEEAKKLLMAAKRHVIFGEEAEGGYADVAFIDGHGLQRSYEPHGTWTVYSKEKLPEPKISPIKPLEAVQAAVWRRRIKPQDVMSWLRGELDKVADAAESHTREERRDQSRNVCGNPIL